MGVLFLIFVISGLIYLLPTAIAAYRRHPNLWLVAAINVMTGLTGIGWLFALWEALKTLPAPVTASQGLGFVTPTQRPDRFTSIDFPNSYIPNRRKQMGFFAAISSCFNNYAAFSGRASRSEYWYFALFFILVGTPLLFLGPVALLLLAMVMPAISVEVRRLHDIDRSGWWFWIGAVPGVGVILKLIWYCQKGSTGENRFGPDPLAEAIHSSVGFAAAPTGVIAKAEQLAKLKGLLDAGTVTQDEFDRMKAEVLAS